MANLILISGKARSGKDTLADFLVEQYGYKKSAWAKSLKEELSSGLHNFSVSFNEYTQEATCYINQDTIIDTRLARKMLFWMSDTDGLKVQYDRDTAMSNGHRNYFIENYAVYGYTMEEKDGNLLQWYGTDYVRKHIDADYWVNTAMEDINNYLILGEDVVVSDTRFLNEIEAARTCGFADKVIVVRVERDGSFQDIGRDENHISEKKLDGYRGFDLTINNKTDISGFIAQFEKEIESFV